MALGVISVVAGIFTADGDHFWSNILVNSFFFLAIGLGALFFYALQYATETGWSALVKRIFEGIYSSIPVFGGILAIVLLVGSLGGHHIYHWMDPHVYEPLLEDGTPNEHYDAIIANKKPFLNLPFFWFRTLVYLATFILFARFFRKKSLQEDEVGGNEIHKLLYRRGALFLVFFAVFSSTLSWDWLMSIDTHWFSTMYGWYTFSGMWVSAMITAILLIRWLKGKGYLPYVNENHIHDLGKWMFALSFLWTYLWFSQFMLIWYSDIPEEVTYFKERIDDFTIPYFLMLAVNFIFPMVMLMSRQAKRTNSILLFVGGLIFLGHWFDVYLMVIPGATHHWHYGLFEAGTFLGFLGLFLYMTLNAFTKASFLPKNHPFLEESKHMHI
ncbi:MAG: quinol:cytochrome C oxidoreductase [Luteibaculum sp.]